MRATREGRGVHPFEYAAPETLAEALALLREHGAEAKVLAGGQSLVPLLNYRLARPRLVVDINGLPLAGVRVDNGSLQLGALTRHHELEELPEIARSAPLLPEVARLIRSEEHTSELQSRLHLVCRLLLEKKKAEQLTHHNA